MADRRWDFVDDDDELDEEGQSARQEAGELREQANALAQFAENLSPGEQQRSKFQEAVGMYRRADTLILRTAGGRKLSPEDQMLVLHCRLNAACLALKAGNETATVSLAEEALDIDAENPHAAFFLARTFCRKPQPNASLQWLERARCWAKKRGEEELLKQADEFLRPSPSPKLSSPNPREWVQQGVSHFKQRRPQQAIKLLGQAVEFLDDSENGGPLERLRGKALRSLAFDALEVLAEALAAEGNFEDAQRYGRRAAGLLGPSAEGPPFQVPDLHKREGLIFLSLGHMAQAVGSDPLPDWRRAVSAFEKHDGEFALQGRAMLRLGSCLAEHVTGNAQTEDTFVDDACANLEKAARRFARARNNLADLCSTDSAAQAQHADLVLNELTAVTTAVGLLCRVGAENDAGKLLEVSAYLQDLVPPDALPRVAAALAEQCRVWALAAVKLGRLEAAESALLNQERLARAAASKTTQLDACKALAVVRRRRGDQPGVEEALTSVSALTPEPERTAEMRKLREMLLQVEPPRRAARTLKARVSQAISGATSSLPRRSWSHVAVLTILVAMLVRPSAIYLLVDGVAELCRWPLKVINSDKEHPQWPRTDESVAAEL